MTAVSLLMALMSRAGIVKGHYAVGWGRYVEMSEVSQFPLAGYWCMDVSDITHMPYIVQVMSEPRHHAPAR